MSHVPQKSSKTPLRILLVDDEPAMRDVLAALLRHYNFEVALATDGLDAWEQMQAAGKGFDVVITDNQMPRMDGMTLIRSLRTANFGGKILVFSSSLTAEKAIALTELGVDAILEKGQSGMAIIAEIRRLAAEG
jgi:two-component system, OmpR family, response regulator MprA